MVYNSGEKTAEALEADVYQIRFSVMWFAC